MGKGEDNYKISLLSLYFMNFIFVRRLTYFFVYLCFILEVVGELLDIGIALKRLHLFIIVFLHSLQYIFYLFYFSYSWIYTSCCCFVLFDTSAIFFGFDKLCLVSLDNKKYIMLGSLLFQLDISNK